MDKKQLLAKVNDTLKQYPQYKGYFDHWVVGQIKKDIKSRGSLAFAKGELVLVEPGVRKFVDMNNKNREMVTAFSMSNKVSTSINFKDMVFL